jgi:hypothetical protein
MKKTCTFMRIIAATLVALAISAEQAHGAVTVYAEDMPSNAAVAVSAALVETNVPPAQTNVHTKARWKDKNSGVAVDEDGIHIGGPGGINIKSPLGTSGGDMSLKSMLIAISAILIPISGVVCPFALPVFIVAIVFYFHHRRTKMTHETIRAMIERGMPVTPELVAELKSKHPRGAGQSPTRRSGLFPGLVLAGIGTALLITNSGHSMGGWIVLFIGVAFLITWLVDRQNQNNGQPPKL